MSEVNIKDLDVLVPAELVALIRTKPLMPLILKGPEVQCFLAIIAMGSTTESTLSVVEFGVAGIGGTKANGRLYSV
jgi:hypothetical protein